MCSLTLFLNIFLEDTPNVFFRSLQILVFTHSSLFQCIWNYQPFQYLLASCIFLFISSFYFWAFLLDLLFFSDGSFWPNVFTYQPLTIAFNNDWHFSFGQGCLGSPIFFIVRTYILQRSRKLCSKDVSQQPMESMVAPSESNDYVVEFDGRG